MIWSKLIQSVLKRGVQAFLVYLASPGLSATLAGWGITTQEGTIFISVFALVEAVRNYLKHQLKLTFL